MRIRILGASALLRQFLWLKRSRKSADENGNGSSERELFTYRMVVIIENNLTGEEIHDG